MASELYKSIQKNTCGYFDTRNYSSKEEYQNALKNSTTLYIGNVNTKTKESQIYELFSKCGPVQRIVIGVNKATLEPCGFAFVVYKTREDAMYAIKTLNGTRLNNQPIRTDIDPGFIEGRQYGRGKEGNQVRQDNQKPFASVPPSVSPAFIQPPPSYPVMAPPQSQSLLSFPPANPMGMAMYGQYQQYPPRYGGSGGITPRGGYKRYYNEREDRGDRDGGYPSKRPRFGEDGSSGDGDDWQQRRYQRPEYGRGRYSSHYDQRYGREVKDYRSGRDDRGLKDYRSGRDDRPTREYTSGRDDREMRNYTSGRDDRDSRRRGNRSRSNSRENSGDERRGDGDVNMEENRVRRGNYTTRY